MDRRRRIRSLARDIYGSGHAVAYPDHPLLARGPDILGQDEGGLVAEFVYGDNSEQPADRREAARILLARLALPKGTRFTLRWIGSGDPDMSGMDLFDEFVVSPQRGGTKRDVIGGEASALVERIRPFHFERFADAWGNSKHSSKRDLNLGASTFSRRSDHVQRPAWVTVDAGHIVANLDQDRDLSAVLPKVQTLAVAATFEDYWLHDGLSGAREAAELLTVGQSHLVMHSLLLDPDLRPSRRTGDPFKPFRAAAFAGARVRYPEVE